MHKTLKYTFNISLIIFSLFIAELARRGLGYLYLSQYNKNEKIEKDDIKVLAIGESTTGLGLDSSYPSQLEDILNKSSSKKFKVFNRGKPGILLKEMFENTKVDIKEFKPDIVIIMAGINDVLYGREKNRGEIRWFENLRLYKLINLIFLEYANANDLNFRLSQSQILELKNNKKALLRFEKTIYESLKNADIDSFRSFYNWVDKTREFELFSNLMLQVYKLSGGKFHRDEQLTLIHFLKYIRKDNSRLFIANELHESYLKNIDIYNKLEFCIDINYRYCRTKNKEMCENYNKECNKLLLSHMQSNHIEVKNIFPNDVVEFLISINNMETLKVYRKYLLSLDQVGAKFSIYSLDLKMCKAFKRNCNDDVKFNINKELENNKYILSYLKKLRDIVLKDKINVIFMGYPLMQIKNMKKYLEKPGVYFVENYNNFIKQVKRSGYEKVFEDRFAYVFGHSTHLGNSLIANNVSKTILKLARGNEKK